MFYALKVRFGKKTLRNTHDPFFKFDFFSLDGCSIVISGKLGGSLIASEGDEFRLKGTVLKLSPQCLTEKLFFSSRLASGDDQ